MESSKYYICEEAIWPELSLVCMSAEFELDSSFCNICNLIWCMVDEYRWRLSIISWKGSDSFCYILAFTWFWIVYTDYIETIEGYLFISENPSFCMSKCSECSFNSEICLMITIRVHDAMRCRDIIEWIKKVLESTIHPVE